MNDPPGGSGDTLGGHWCHAVVRGESQGADVVLPVGRWPHSATLKRVGQRNGEPPRQQRPAVSVRTQLASDVDLDVVVARGHRIEAESSLGVERQRPLNAL